MMGKSRSNDRYREIEKPGLLYHAKCFSAKPDIFIDAEFNTVGLTKELDLRRLFI